MTGRGEAAKSGAQNLSMSNIRRSRRLMQTDVRKRASSHYFGGSLGYYVPSGPGQSINVERLYFD